MIGPPEVEAAGNRIAEWVRHTPTMALRTPAGAEVWLKLELLQHTGSFKPRGAFSSLLADPPDRVVAASGGNHGLAVAFAAGRLDLPAEIFVPELISVTKLERLRAVGASVTVVPGVYADALRAAERRAAETGARSVHAYDDDFVMAGQGTVGRELEHDAGTFDTVLVSVGGGGLAAGISAWFTDRSRIVGVETPGTRTWAAALQAGRPVHVDVSGPAADALGASQLGDGPFEQLCAWRAGSIVVDDAAVLAAQRHAWSELRLIVEPGGATALAAVLSGAYLPAEGERVAVIVCGSNADPATIV